MPKIAGLALFYSLLISPPARALPPPEDTPEAILRTEIITEAQSPRPGEPLSAAYAILMEQLQDPNRNPQVSTDVAGLIALLQFRRVVKPVLPFIR